MKRVIYYDDGLNNNKYVLIKEYKGHGIYQHKTPTGYFVSQEYAIASENIMIVCDSFNHYCKDALLDSIDEFIETGKYGLKVFKRSIVYMVHPSGNMMI